MYKIKALLHMSYCGHEKKGEAFDNMYRSFKKHHDFLTAIRP